MSDLTGLISEVGQTVAVEQRAIAEMVALVPVTVAIVNQSTVVTDAQLTPIIEALKIQVIRDFAPAWGATARLAQFTKAQAGAIPASNWQIAILDDTTQAGALGYHDITASGQPLGKVFAKTTMADGLSWTVTLSHELLETLCDPFVNVACEVDNANGVPTRFYAREVGDAPEDDAHGYLIDGVLLSDFTYPAWFMPGMPGPYDFQKKITAPFQLLPGGYISFLDVTTKNGWQQIQAEKDPSHPNTRSQRRLQLRRKPRSEWTRSAF
jgi:hypothetical protein